MEKMDMQTPDFTDENIARIAELFPNCVTESGEGQEKAIDFDKEMKRIQKTFKAILAEEAKSQVELKKAFKGLGYEI